MKGLKNTSADSADRYFRQMAEPLDIAASFAPPDGLHRPDGLRRAAIVFCARTWFVTAFLVAPLGVLPLVSAGQAIPFAVSILVLGFAFVLAILQIRREHEQMAGVSVLATLMVGLTYAVVLPGLSDLGLALALLAPVSASLLGGGRLTKLSWAGVVAVVAISALAYSAGVPPVSGAAAGSLVAMSALSFLATIIAVAFAAHRLSGAFEIVDKAQLDAARHVLESVRDAVLRFSSSARPVFISRSAEDLFGCRTFELDGNGLAERIHILDRPEFLNAFADANRDGRARTIEVRARKDDPERPGSAPRYMWVEVAFSPVPASDGPQGRHEVITLIRDVTDRRDAEASMRAAHLEAQKASAAKSQFLANVGHELRTPLNAIVGFSELMANGIGGELSDGQKEYAVLIRESGRHLLDVVNMLLDMSKIEAGRFELQTEAFDPSVLVEPCRQIVEPLARAHQVRIVTDVAAALPALVADERACRQILINLLSNAVKFSKSGGEVRLGIKRMGQRVVVTVKDNGIGMPPDVVARLGEPFFQAQDGLSRQYEGTGLGLSIVKGLVDLHQGTLDVVSEPGRGTTVTVCLPIEGPQSDTGEPEVIRQIKPEPQPDFTHSWPKRKSVNQ